MSRARFRDMTFYNGWGEEFHAGDYCYSRRPGPLGVTTEGTVARARAAYRCQICRGRIERDDPHASMYYTHFCLDCATKTHPPGEWTEVDEQAHLAAIERLEAETNRP